VTILVVTTADPAPNPFRPSVLPVQFPLAFHPRECRVSGMSWNHFDRLGTGRSRSGTETRETKTGQAGAGWVQVARDAARCCAGQDEKTRKKTATLAAMKLAALLASSLAALCLLFTRSSQADLDQDMTRLAAAWHDQGEVHRLAPHFVERGTIRPLFLQRELTNPLRDDCLTVVVMGVPSTSFVMRFLPARGALFWPEGEHPEASAAGAAQLVRCGVRKAMLDRLAIEMRSPRGLIEVLAVRTPRPLPPLAQVLEHRDPGPIAPLGVSGPAPLAAPLQSRVHAIESRVRRDGAADVARRSVSAGPDGAGEIALALAPGCHRLDLLATSADAAIPVDVDADLISERDAELIATDRSENADATLPACVGEPTRVRLHFVGAPARGALTLLFARWDLPAGLPVSWGPTLRARMAEALQQHRGPKVEASPIYSSLGVSGITLLPIELDPGGCYLAAVAALRGDPSGVALSIERGRHQSQNHGGPGGPGTALAFCADGSSEALADVEVRGGGVSWLFALWPAGHHALGERGE
jgi:hypothetical protein